MEQIWKLIIIMLLPSIVLMAVVIWQFRTYRKKEEERHARMILNDKIANVTSIDECYFTVSQMFGESSFMVVKKFRDYPSRLVLIKSFDDEDEDYALRCAEELCDKLNEKI